MYPRANANAIDGGGCSSLLSSGKTSTQEKREEEGRKTIRIRTPISCIEASGKLTHHSGIVNPCVDLRTLAMISS